MNSSRVYIVGAGPGDPSLISVRGLRCLEAADVVVYDHRVHARLLRWRPPGPNGSTSARGAAAAGPGSHLLPARRKSARRTRRSSA